MRIVVLGAGSWGTTLAILLSNNAHQVILWSHREDHAEALLEHRENRDLLPGITIPEKIEITHDVTYAIDTNPDVVVAAVPAQFLRSTIERIKVNNFSNTIFVNVAKGIENNSLMTMSEVLLDVLSTTKKEKIATLSGPSFAEEVSRKIPTAVVVASHNLDTAKFVQKIFMAQYFRVYSSDDIRGVELAGSIKNVIAIGAGIADGAGFGDNTKAAIMTRATAELSRLGQPMGAQQRTFAGLSGIGDLIVTCMSKHSRNRHVGEEIGRGRKLKDVLAEMMMVAEGVATTRSVHDLGRKYNIELPIVNEVYRVLFENKDPIMATSDLMTRDAKGEI
ncbi:MAG TPA: NAD(P)H-dependent glycerol-3-phosphate dehydrogenase [Bacteroidota bacterium]|nr:NAD(P)H-dependent glycerol-3-phosphate dehydrogenase [Bacteroidota bacterium]